ncbi:MAG TPA: phospho-sugar mutase [Pirellulales bacterium]
MNQTPLHLDIAQIDAALAALASAVDSGLLSASANANVKTWLSAGHYSEYAPPILEHIATGKWRELDDAFWTVIPFGTAGRRGRMYPIGTNAINDRTMGESAQGLADYTWSVVRGPSSAAYGLNSIPMDNGQRIRDLRCAIAYDTRHRSRHFAELCAEIMVASGFEVLFFDGFRPTPELSFAVRDQRCACGIMVSASHNPPSDNAIKAFWSSGGQLRSPHDEGVIACVKKVTTINRVPFAQAVADGSVKFLQNEMDRRYQSAVLDVGWRSLDAPSSIADSAPRTPRSAFLTGSPLKILYSPLHGVGLTSVLPILHADGFINVEVYQPHAAPDGDFPNVPAHVANPENPAVFDAPIEHAKSTTVDLVLASDPDADRIGCAAKISLDQWATLSGNQIGALLADLLLRRLQSAGRLTPEHYVIKTLVTSDMICRIAEYYGIRAFGDVLTGFKWIGSKIDEVGPEKFVFGFEEAHGYLAGTYARDKDGAVAAMLLAELAAQCKSDGRTLHDQLDHLFLKHGCHQERSISHIMPGADGLEKMRAVMHRLRIKPPAILGGLSITRVRDYLQQRNLANAIYTPLTGVPQSDLLIFDLDPAGNRAAIRPSGTEPKLKFYLFAYDPPEQSADLASTKRRLSDRLAAVAADLQSAADSIT